MCRRGIPLGRLNLLVGAGIIFGLCAVGPLDGQDSPLVKLRIGSSGSLAADDASKKEQSALQTLQAFIKDETGLDNEILRQKDWRQLVDKMAKGDLQLGVFQGYEFAWAQEQHALLKPLAIAVNVYRYPVAYVVVNKNDPAQDFAGLSGKTLSIPSADPRFVRLFIDHECATAGKTADAFFAKITTPDGIEDAIDDVVDGVTQATAVDRAALEAFKRSKPARFAKLRPVTKSPEFPPPLVAYYGSVLDEATRARFQKGLLEANKKEKGETMLTMFHLTGFEAPPSDLDKVLAATHKQYPPPTK
jgi:ABC-type phosphate/phosphonate transport system substrate-binding protein